jgi:hypothetical protein
LWVLLEQRAVVRRLQVALDAHHAIAPHLGQDLVHQLQQRDVVLALVAWALGQRQGADERCLDDLGWVADQEGASSRADDDQHFKGVPEDEDVAPLGGKPAEDASNNHQ